MKAGQLIAAIESQDLAAAQDAAEATAASEQWKLNGTEETERQTRGETTSATVNAEAQVKAAQAALDQAQAKLEHQQADTDRTVALAEAGNHERAVEGRGGDGAEGGQGGGGRRRGRIVARREAHCKQARAHELLAAVSAAPWTSTRARCVPMRRLSPMQARVEEGYAQVCCAAGSGRSNVWAARQGEVVAAGAPIVTIMDLTQTWVYAPLPETRPTR